MNRISMCTLKSGRVVHTLVKASTKIIASEKWWQHLILTSSSSSSSSSSSKSSPSSGWGVIWGVAYKRRRHITTRPSLPQCIQHGHWQLGPAEGTLHSHNEPHIQTNDLSERWNWGFLCFFKKCEGFIFLSFSGGQKKEKEFSRQNVMWHFHEKEAWIQKSIQVS